MSANTVQPDPNRYDPALGDPLAPTPTSGNDEVESMCNHLEYIAQNDYMIDAGTLPDGIQLRAAAAMLRKQAARIGELESAYNVRNDEVDGLLGQFNAARAQIDHLVRLNKSTLETAGKEATPANSETVARPETE